MTGPILIAFAAVVAVAVAGLVLTVRLTVRTGGLSPSMASPTELEIPRGSTRALEPAPRQAPRALPRKTSAPRGSRPPAKPQLLTMQVSEWCSDGACVLCPGNGCQCTCLHSPAEIVRRNVAEYDRTHTQEVPA